MTEEELKKAAKLHEIEKNRRKYRRFTIDATYFETKMIIEHLQKLNVSPSIFLRRLGIALAASPKLVEAIVTKKPKV